jgi:multiple sugar transport system ATP-binding protein
MRGRDGARVVGGIRPENVAPPGRSPRGEAASLRAVVEIAEPLGDQVVVHGRAGEDVVVFRQDPHCPVAIGDALQVQVELDALHLFDAESQRRIGD